jgi:hypothetical protein
MTIGSDSPSLERRFPEGTPVAYWLLPCEKDRDRLQTTIDLLSRELDAPLFVPHVTLYSTVLARDEDPVELIRNLAKRFTEIKLTCGPTGHSGMLFKTLYIEFNYQQVATLATALRDQCRHQSSYRLEPHLSLLYRSLPSAARDALAQRMDFAGKTVRFDAIAAVTPGFGNSDFHDVSSWTVCAHESLQTPPSEQPVIDMPDPKASARPTRSL